MEFVLQFLVDTIYVILLIYSIICAATSIGLSGSDLLLAFTLVFCRLMDFSPVYLGVCTAAKINLLLTLGFAWRFNFIDRIADILEMNFRDLFICLLVKLLNTTQISILNTQISPNLHYANLKAYFWVM